MEKEIKDWPDQMHPYSGVPLELMEDELVREAYVIWHESLDEVL